MLARIFKDALDFRRRLLEGFRKLFIREAFRMAQAKGPAPFLRHPGQRRVDTPQQLLFGRNEILRRCNVNIWKNVLELQVFVCW